MVKAPDGRKKYEPNWFGTNEFVRFCRLIVGNESWGCGGDFVPDEYAVEFRRYTAWLTEFGVNLALIGSGPNGGDIDWTRRFFNKLTEKSKHALHHMYGWAVHYYCGTSRKGRAVDFTVDDWYSLLAKSTKMDSLITDHWAAMGEIDTEHRVKLAAHRGAQAVRALFAAKQHENLTGLAGSASIQGKTLVLTAVNTDAGQPLETGIILRGASVRSAKASTLAHPDIHAHNTFSNPNVVQVREETIQASGTEFTYRLPPASVNKLVLDLA